MTKLHHERGDPTCAHCGRTIFGNWITALDRFWHPEHLICQQCGKQIDHASFYSSGTAVYHPECYADAFSLRCAICGKACQAQYVRDSHNHVFCPTCYAGAVPCKFCGRTLPSGRSCSVCVPLIVDSVAATREFETAIRWVKSTGISFYEEMRDIELILKPELPMSRHATSGTSPLGWTEVSWAWTGLRKRHTVSVWMRTELPSLVFRGVAVHELGHVWLLTSGIVHLRAEESEGFCELMSYLYYRSVKTQEAKALAQRIRENPDPVYGGGFRSLVEAYKGMELPQLATLLEKSASSSHRVDRLRSLKERL